MKSAFIIRVFAAFLFVVLLVAGVQGATAPAPSCGTLTGVLRDADTHEPIPGTNVVLLSRQGNKLIGSAKTRADGTFRLDKVPFGSYTLHATVLGYQLHQPTVTFSPRQAHVALGTLSLQPLNRQLLAFAAAAR